MTVIEIDHARTRARAASTGSSTRVVPQSVKGRIRRIKWAVLIVTLAIYYLAPFLRWERGIGEPNQAILLDFEHGRLYAFFIEIWPQELYYVTGLLILRDDPHPRERDRRPPVVRLRLPADGLDRPVPLGGAADRRRSPRRPEEDRRAPDVPQARRDRNQTRRRALDLGRDRRRAGVLFQRCADACARARSWRGLGHRLGLDRGVHRHHLRPRGLRARPGLYLHVPVAEAAGRDLGSRSVHGQLPRLPRRKAHVGEEGR